MRQWARLLIRNNTGYSTRSFMLLWGAWFATTLVVHFVAIDWYCQLMGVEPIVNYYGWAAVLSGIAAVVLAVVWGKSKQDSYEQHWRQDDNQPRGSGISEAP